MRKRTVASALCALGLLLTTGAAGAATIELVPLATPLGIGGTFDVEIRVTGLGDAIAPSVSAFDLDITFDETLVSFLGVTFASELGDPDTETLYGSFLGLGLIDLFQISSLTPAALDALQGATVLLATLQFSGDQLGVSALAFTQNLVGDAFGASLSPTAVGSSIEVVPEPSTAALLGCGLIALGMRRRRCTRWVRLATPHP